MEKFKSLDTEHSLPLQLPNTNSNSINKNSPSSLLTRSSTTNFTPLPLCRSRLPVPRVIPQKLQLKRSPSPLVHENQEEEDNEIENLNNLNSYYQSAAQATPSPSKFGKVGSVSEIVKQRFYSLTPSPLKVRSTVIGGIFSSTSNAQSTRRLSLGANTQSSKLNSYGIRSELSPIKSNHPSTSSSRRKSNINNSLGETDRIKVCVRKRPLSEREIQNRQTDILEINYASQSISVLEDRVRLDGISKYTEKHEFRFDRVFNIEANNHQIYSSCIRDLVDTVISGGRATCFAYGQTGSGKTHTMLNSGDGLNYLAAHDLLAQTSLQIPDVSIYVIFYEIYQNSLYDLLNQKRRVMACEGKDGEVHIVGITEVAVSSDEHLKQVMLEALTTRSTGTTAANSTSSRSHAILQFVLKNSGGGIHGKFSFIDLAGSERGSDRANVDKQTKLEGAEINKSLLALKECIRAIDQDSAHLPFRQSKLTLVLKDSFTGNAKTCMIATVSPSSANCDHTINTLRYADRVKELKGPSNLGIEGIFSLNSKFQSPLKSFKEPRDCFVDTSRVETPTKITFPTSPLISEFKILNYSQPTVKASNNYNNDNSNSNTNDVYDPLCNNLPDLIMNESLNEEEDDSNDSFLMSCSNSSSLSISSRSSAAKKPKSIARLRENLHHSIAVLYDRVSNCGDEDLLELLGDELDGILAAFNK